MPCIDRQLDENHTNYSAKERKHLNDLINSFNVNGAQINPNDAIDVLRYSPPSAEFSI